MKEVRKWNNPHLLKMIQHYKSANNIYLAMEYYNGGDLLAKILDGKLTEKDSIRYFKQIVKGMIDLWKHNIMHRDLKPQNIMLHNDVIKIVDFGLSKESGANIYLTSLGTPLTMAPEVLNRKPYCNKADIWSLGTILYMMLEVRLPFHPRNQESILDCIDRQKRPIFYKTFTPFTIELVNKCLAVKE